MVTYGGVELVVVLRPLTAARVVVREYVCVCERASAVLGVKALAHVCSLCLDLGRVCS